MNLREWTKKNILAVIAGLKILENTKARIDVIYGEAYDTYVVIL